MQLGINYSTVHECNQLPLQLHQQNISIPIKLQIPKKSNNYNTVNYNYSFFATILHVCFPSVY